PVGCECPERVFERRGPVVFDEEMTCPRAGVTDHQRRHDQPELSHDECRDQTDQPGAAAREMQQAIGRPAVFAHIKRPELLKTFEALLLTHPETPRSFHLFPKISASTSTTNNTARIASVILIQLFG